MIAVDTVAAALLMFAVAMAALFCNCCRKHAEVSMHCIAHNSIHEKDPEHLHAQNS